MVASTLDYKTYVRIPRRPEHVPDTPGAEVPPNVWHGVKGKLTELSDLLGQSNSPVRFRVDDTNDVDGWSQIAFEITGPAAAMYEREVPGFVSQSIYPILHGAISERALGAVKVVVQRGSRSVQTFSLSNFVSTQTPTGTGK